MTKFSELKHKFKAEWKLYYVDVAYLKSSISSIKQSLRLGSISKQEAERNFTNLVELEIRKVNDFYLRVHNDIKEKILSLRKLLSQVIYFYYLMKTLYDPFSFIVYNIIIMICFAFIYPFTP